MISGRNVREEECEHTFRALGQVYNANTPENHPIVFNTVDDYKAGMSILAVCARMWTDVRIYAFQLMSNHIHLVTGGEENRIYGFFNYFVSRLRKYFGGRVDFSGFTLKLFPVESLSYLRNAIVYVNRNGFVINNDVTPFSYPWGSSAYFFQPMTVRYAEMAGRPLGLTALRSLMHTRYCDELRNLKMVDGYVSPLEFINPGIAEQVYRDAKQYFYLISRNVETYVDVAKSIGESIFYCDNDLYIAAAKLAREHFGARDLKTLTATNKLELAKCLHYDYNAGDKQLQRLLKIDAGTLKALF